MTAMSGLSIPKAAMLGIGEIKKLDNGFATRARLFQ
jgi:hypothetical protein